MPTDTQEMQDELARRFADASSRAADTWMEALKNLGVSDTKPKSSSSHAAGSEAQASASKIFELIRESLEDFSRTPADDATRRTERMRRKWAREHERLMKSALGIPDPPSAPGLFFGSSPLQWGCSFPWLPAASAATPAEIWLRVMLGMPMQAGSAFHDPIKSTGKNTERILELQLNYAKSLAAVHEAVALAAKDSVDALAAKMTEAFHEADIETTTNRFIRIWATAYENTLSGLINRKDFRDLAADVRKTALEAGELMAETVSTQEVADQAHERRNLIERLDRLEAMVRALYDDMKTRNAKTGDALSPENPTSAEDL